MAIRTAWWMRRDQLSRSRSLSSTSSNSRQPRRPYHGWPGNLPGLGLALNVLEQALNNGQGGACDIDKLYFGCEATPAEKPLWRHCGHIAVANELEVMVTEQWPNNTYNALYIVTQVSAEVLQILGYYLDLPPRFFNFPYTMVSTGVTVERFVFFNLQLMEQYPINNPPQEARRVENPPKVRFRTSSGWAEHEWNVTRIALIFIRAQDGIHFNGIVHLDPLDKALRDAIKMLAVKNEDELPGLGDHKLGLASIVTEVLYVIQFTWGVFLQEAADYLHVLSKRCVEEELSSAEQLTYTRELHKIAPLWVEVRRRIICAKDVSQQMINHPFFAAIDARHSIESYLIKTIQTLEDHVIRSNELTEETNVLISLIFNIATLQDTRAAVEESRAANEVASSIRRVTVLTFVYLPLTLAAGVFGMNIYEISGNDSNPSIWAFFALSIALTTATFGAWAIWSKCLDRKKRSRGATNSVVVRQIEPLRQISLQI